jgi:four helix bundle protein
MAVYDLEQRTRDFAIAVRRKVGELNPSTANFEDGKQVVRSSGSIGANYIEANENLGKKDFLMRLKSARKEKKEINLLLGISCLEFGIWNLVLINSCKIKMLRGLHIATACIFCASFLLIQAQDTTVVLPGQLDSLQELIEQSREDTNKVTLLNEYARLSFYDLEYLSGLSAAKEARSLAAKLKYRNGELQFFKTISHFHRNTTLGSYFLIISDWQSNEGIPQDALTGAFSHPIGLYDHDLNRIQKQLFLALDSFKNTGDEEIMANLYFAIFDNSGKLGNTDQAGTYWDLTYQAFVELGQPFPQVLLLFDKISFLRSIDQVDSARQLEIAVINLVDQTEDLKLKGLMFFVIGNHYLFAQGRFNLALEYYLKSVDALKEIEGGLLYMQLVNLLGATYTWAGNDEKAIFYFEKVLEYYQDHVNQGKHTPEGLELQMVWTFTNIADPLVAMNRTREADEYLELAQPIAEKYKASIPYGRYYQFKALVSNKEGRYDDGLTYNQLALEEFKKLNVSPFLSQVSQAIARYYQRSGDLTKAIDRGMEAYDYGLSSNRADNAIEASLLVSELYEQAGQTQRANEFLKTHLKLRDENEALDLAKRFEDAELKSLLESQNREIATLEKDRILQEQERRNQRLWIFSISGALISAIILAIILFRNAQSRKKANTILNRQKDETERTLNQLKETQNQLIHSEKMASLGELTAGIAHEIKNPLNFVNNFSELNTELLDEMVEEIQQGDQEEAFAIVDNLKQNLQKIIEHGRRADGIVKGMLLHSRGSTGDKEPTDINALCDEYLRLAYHGLRAKDSTFNASMETDFDENLPKIEIVPQDIGRVLLNLITNAFYVVNEKSKSHEETDYKPLVTIRTTVNNGSLNIAVLDNGPGIPEEIKDKIFQPFFTTKPTGEGTGLGLSLSYDIVKAHGGTIRVESDTRLGTTFTILLPMN